MSKMTTDQANNKTPILGLPGYFSDPSGDKSQDDSYTYCRQVHRQPNDKFWDSRVVNVEELEF